MVTGLELAGLILATFPLIISGLDAYENGFQTMKEWSRFRKEYLVFMTALGKQKLFFRQNITTLLDPIVKSEDHMMRLLEDPAGKEWKDPELDDMLRRRLEGLEETYECYMETVCSILALLEKLKGKLKLGDGEVHWTANATASGIARLEYEFRRLTYTLGRKKRADILSKIEKHIDEMSRILSNSERLAPQRIKRKSPISKHFQQVRSQASSLHAALSQAWKCNCFLGHAAKLLLERRVHTSEETKIYDWKMEDSAIKFEVYFSINLEPSTSTAPNKKTTTQNSEWCATAITIDPSLNSDRSHLDNLTGIYGPRSSMATSNISSLTKTGLKSTTRPLLDECRRVSFADTSVSSKSISFVNEVSEIIDLCSALNQQPSSQQNFGYLRDQQLDKLHTVTLGANSQLPSGTYKIISLDSLLGTGKGRSSNLSSALTTRRTRLEVAVILATSLLQLHPGPWLGERWGKRDIFFFQSADGIIHTHLPFLLSQFQSSTTLHSNSNMDGTPTNLQSRGGPSPPLLSLGILILELWFNQSIESLRFRNDYLGKGGKTTEYTDYNTAQKWLEQTMDEAGPDLHDPTRRCIYCAFGASSQNLEDDELRKAVCDGVVAPLERLLQRFEEV
ncbi:hypothetical protein L211DRAFT_806386 [Terfezia boudieri ATCC MYA-4762]|uniref:DUF7580 domain-containing protein n=1 Tax=Terfezia boudieri ATCC MYA-4762 TaxID=1051890 RepID=A0A3N4LWY7_9PEZI|nr:hypothetical protein L211DRAFT_806386 [Terfezia boudieri ATCC MYA-4762]